MFLHVPVLMIVDVLFTLWVPWLDNEYENLKMMKVSGKNLKSGLGILLTV